MSAIRHCIVILTVAVILASQTYANPQAVWPPALKGADANGNITYGDTGDVVRDVSGPSITTFALANEAADNYVTLADSTSTSALATLTADDVSSDDFAIVNSVTVCNNLVTYDLTDIPQIDALVGDGVWKLCTELSDANGNVTAVNFHQ